MLMMKAFVGLLIAALFASLGPLRCCHAFSFSELLIPNSRFSHRHHDLANPVYYGSSAFVGQPFRAIIATPSSCGNTVSFRRGQAKVNDDDDADTNTDDFDVNETNTKNGALSFLSGFLYGANRVHEEFPKLCLRMYSTTLLWMAPFFFILYWILPTMLLSPSHQHQTIAIRIQLVLQHTVSYLANLSKAIICLPLVCLHLLLKATTFWQCHTKRGVFVRRLSYGIVFGPMFEELVYRYGFYNIWKAMSRSTRVKSTHTADYIDGDGTEEVSQQVEHSNVKTDDIGINAKEESRNWMIASGLVFAISHFSNYFPVEIEKYFNDIGKIVIPQETFLQRTSLALFPQGFTDSHEAFCLVNLKLTSAFFQAIHCFLHTINIYGPLFQSHGIFASIGAHILWNFNSTAVVSNLQIRLFCRLIRVCYRRYTTGVPVTTPSTEQDDGLNTS